MKTFKDILKESKFKKIKKFNIPGIQKNFFKKNNTLESKEVDIIDDNELFSGIIYAGETKNGYSIILNSFDLGRDYKISFNDAEEFKKMKDKIRDRMSIKEYQKLGFKAF